MRRSLSHSMMAEVLRQISYKARVHQQVDQYYPSTKRCSACGAVKAEMPLDERTYSCEHCGAVIDRDLNAAMNICQAGAVSPGEPVEPAASCRRRSRKYDAAQCR